jgi:hypothetical protein
VFGDLFDLKFNLTNSTALSQVWSEAQVRGQAYFGGAEEQRGDEEVYGCTSRDGLFKVWCSQIPKTKP